MQYIERLSSLANFDVFSFFNIACLRRTSYLDSLVFKIVVPTAVLVAIFAACVTEINVSSS